MPLWLIGLGTVAAACTIYLAFNFSLAGTSDIAFGQFTTLPPHGPVQVARVAAPAPPPNTGAPAPSRFLQPEVAAGLVQVMEDPQSITVRLTNRTMFASGSAGLNPNARPLLERIGKAVRDEADDVLVDGYTDNQPSRSGPCSSRPTGSCRRRGPRRSPRCWHRNCPRPFGAGRGQGRCRPLARNTTADGREHNRRTEIVLRKTARLP